MSRDSIIDNAVSCGNYKLASQLVQQKIQQNPNSSYFYALKADILSRQGLKFRALALQLATKLIDSKPRDSESLALLAQVFDRCDSSLDKSPFEVSTAKYQTFSFAYEWYNYSVRNCDLPQLQRATMLLAKCSDADQASHMSPRTAELYAATGCLLACKCCQRIPAMKRRIFSMLGLKMVEKAVPANAEEVYLQCELLKLAGKDDQCIRILRPFLAKENNLQLKIIYLQALAKSEDYDTLFRIARHYLVDLKEDDWNTWKLLIKASEDDHEKCMKVISAYADTRNKGLALILLSESDPAAKEKYVREYIDRFGTKKCCYLDLKPFLDPSFASQTDKILEDVYTNRISTVKAVTDSDLNLVVNYLAIKLHTHPELLGSASFIDQCIHFYYAASPLLDHLQEFDLSPSADLVIMASQAMLVQGGKVNRTSLLLRTVVILEDALAHNPYEFHLKMWLINLYIQLNLPGRALELFNDLKVKFVQLDTLSPMVTTRITTLGIGDEVDTLLSDVASFYTKNASQEVPYMTMNCFQSLTLSKIQGFFEFAIRIRSSFTGYLNTVEQIRSCRLYDDQRKIDLTLKDEVRRFYKTYVKRGSDVDEKISDNRDLTTFWDCGIHEKVDGVNSILHKGNPLVDLDYLALASLLNLLIYDYESVLFPEYAAEYMKLYSRIESIPCTDAEKWNFSVLAHLIDPKVDPLQMPELSNSTLDFNYSHARFVMADTVKQLSYIIAHSNSTISIHLKEAKQLKKQISARLKNVRLELSDYKVLSKNQVADEKKKALEWFKDEGARFQVSDQVIAKLFKSIELQGQKSMAQLGKI